ncbi:hypothetical protein [Chryseobacterium sp.]|uniref:hypothetical protein n=1 Tax=Chryseobacterium sp. TaxID=1871047 RepID=UPI00289DB974|nr:hypothetical protein [Chryseobacterium sp.]
MILKKTQQLKTLFYDFIAYRNHKNTVAENPDKAVLVNFQNPQLYHRFFYLLLKFYQLAGYTVFYPMSFSMYRNIRNKDRYMALLLHEKNLLNINTENMPEDIIILKDSMFSADYFKDYFENDNKTNKSFYVPMSFHPYMYYFQHWNIPVEEPAQRHHTVFCYGNFDKNAYLEIRKTGFKVASRTEILEFLKENPNFISVKSSSEIENKSVELSGKLVFAMRENYQIDMKDIRPLLSKFNFYLCCPGVVMPLCHNVVEAMSVGTIPIIEKEYAEVMYPNLEHLKNAIIFNDLKELEELLQNIIFKISQEEISEMRENSLIYYKEFLTPEGMIKNLNKNISEGRKIYLQAEHRSVKFKK